MMWWPASKYNTEAFIQQKLGAIQYWICALSVSGKWPLRSPSTHPRTDHICSLLSSSQTCHAALMSFPSRILADQITNHHVLSSVLWRVVLSFKLTVTRLMQITSIDRDLWLTIRGPASTSVGQHPATCSWEANRGV